MKPTIDYTDFEKLELRIGEVVEATLPDWSRKLLELKVNFGPEIGQKTIFSGVRTWYTPEDFIGKKFAFIVNLAEKKMGSSVSQGMMLMADVLEPAQPILMPVDSDVPNGTMVR